MWVGPTRRGRMVVAGSSLYLFQNYVLSFCVFDRIVLPDKADGLAAIVQKRNSGDIFTMFIH